MTTNVQLNPTRQPDGERIASDKDTSNQHYQKIKLAHGMDGTFTDSNYQNPFPVINESDSISFGNVTGAVPFRKFGYNGNLGTTALLISPDGITNPFFAQTAVKAAVWSSSDNDSAAGSHMRTMTLEGLLGTTWLLGTETMTMAGTSTATSSQSWHRVWRNEGIAAGTFGNSNAGTVTIAGVGTSTFMALAPGFGQSEHAHFTVPAGKTFYLRDVHFTVDAAKAVNVKFWQITDATNTNAIKRIVQRYNGMTGSPDFEYDPFQKFREFTDLWATASTTSVGGAVSIELNGFLVDD